MLVVLERVSKSRNCYRFFEISVEPNLFMDVSLVVRWGRIGCPGRSRIRASGRLDEISCRASRIVSEKIGRGYRPVAVGGRNIWAVSSGRTIATAANLLQRSLDRYESRLGTPPSGEPREGHSGDRVR